MSEFGERYAELMAPAIVDGLSNIEGQFNSDDPAINFFRCQPLVNACLEAIDWGATGLPIHTFSTRHDQLGEKDLPPGKFAERLMHFAFEDAYRIFKISENYVNTHDLPDETTFGQLLVNSKQSLLAIAELADPDKSHLLSAIEIPEFSTYFDGLVINSDPLEVKNDARGNLRFEWNTDITKWIDVNKHPGRGCPALRIIVNDPATGSKKTLIYYFWDKIIEACYPISPTVNS